MESEGKYAVRCVCYDQKLKSFSFNSTKTFEQKQKFLQNLKRDFVSK